MYMLGEQPAYVDRLINHLQSIPGKLLEGLMPCGPVLTFDSVNDLNSELPATQLYLLESGTLHAKLDNRPLFYLQEGDLVGLRQGVEFPNCIYSSDTPLKLIPYSRTQVFKHIHSQEHLQELFLRYLMGQSSLLSDAVARLKQPEVHPIAGFKHFETGDALIQQGETAEHVFVITEGAAQVFVDGHKVGEVHKEEIFGAMAVFTQEKRSATVIASQPCSVMVIPKNQFISLLHSNPRITHSLIETMARRIDLLNKEVTQLRELA